MNESNLHIQIQKAFDWLAQENGVGFLSSEELCVTRDVFQARLEKMNIFLKQEQRLDAIASLVVAIVGEIGNNAFDHNLGNWRDEAGLYFTYDISSRLVVLADRGLGIQTTLKRVRPEIQNDCEALMVALKEVVTSRAPEKRGNGLKLVEKLVLAQNMELDMYSGVGHYTIKQGLTSCSRGERVYQGVVAVLKL